MNDEETMVWTVRLSDERPERKWAIFATAGAAFLLGIFILGQPMIGALGAAMVLGATSDYWLGSRFSLDQKGATARSGPSVTFLEWERVRRIIERGREVRLSPLETPSRLDEFRGVGLLTTADNREAVLGFVRAHVPEEAI